MSLRAELVVDSRNFHGEGILWNPLDQKIWWTDIFGRKLWTYDPASGESETMDTPGRVCCFAPRRDGGLLLALAERLAFSETGHDAQPFWDFEADLPETRFNDGRTDRQGRFVAGGMDEKTGAAISSVVRVDADGSVSTIIKNVTISKSICFSPNGETLYFTDTPTGKILAYPYDVSSGLVGDPRVLVDLSGQPGAPDGSSVDSQGGIWNAEWGGSRVVRYTPEGEVDVVVEVPVSNITCCAFGGPKLETLFITTSRIGLDETALADQPSAGGLYAVDPGFTGLEDAPFAG